MRKDVLGKPIPIGSLVMRPFLSEFVFHKVTRYTKKGNIKLSTYRNENGNLNQSFSLEGIRSHNTDYTPNWLPPLYLIDENADKYLIDL